jgi:hypothetical protein
VLDRREVGSLLLLTLLPRRVAFVWNRAGLKGGGLLLPPYLTAASAQERARLEEIGLLLLRYLTGHIQERAGLQGGG